MHHAVTSSIAAHAMATAPIGVRTRLRSREDARQHGKRRHAHRRAHEQREPGERHALAGERRIEDNREDGAEQKWRDDARVADHDGGASALAHHLRIELEADEEHEHEQPDLAQRVQESEASSGKECAGDRWRMCAEQRWTEGNSGEHLADDLRLAEPPDEHPNHSCRHEDDDDLREQQRKVRDGRR